MHRRVRGSRLCACTLFRVAMHLVVWRFFLVSLVFITDENSKHVRRADPLVRGQFVQLVPFFVVHHQMKGHFSFGQFRHRFGA